MVLEVVPAIYRDLVDDRGIAAGYASVQRFVRRLRAEGAVLRADAHPRQCARFVEQREDVLLLGPTGTGKSHLAQAIVLAAIAQGHRVAYREAHGLLEELADATLDGARKEYIAPMAAVPLLIVDDLGMRKLPPTAADDLLELVMRRYERASALPTLEPPRRRLGQAARRQRGCHRHAGPLSAPRPRPRVRTEELAHQALDHLTLAGDRREALTKLRLGRSPMAGLQTSMHGRFRGVHRGMRLRAQ